MLPEYLQCDLSRCSMRTVRWRGETGEGEGKVRGGKPVRECVAPPRQENPDRTDASPI